MRVARILCAAFALTFLAGWATSSSACENHKSTKATASAAGTRATAVAADSKGAACSAAMAASCTPEMMAACKASLASGGPDLCTAKKAGAAAAAAHAGCAAKGASATAVTAANRSASANTVYLAGSNGSCGAKASTASAGHCSGYGMAAVAAMSGHSDCDACMDMAECSGKLDAAGAHRQVVRLKNGIMYVYTADSPRTVSAVQAAVSHRAERMVRFASAGEKAHLCGECKLMRGAMASGKLNREVINIEGGSLTLVTSPDPTVVAKIHAMTNDKLTTRVKS